MGGVKGRCPAGGPDLCFASGSPADQTEVPPPPDKMAPPPKSLIQEQICSEICHSKPLLSGLVEVPPPTHVYAGGSCTRLSPEPTGEQPRPRAGGTIFLSSSVFAFQA